VTLTLLTLAVEPAGAVVFGEPDGDDHPYVGLAVFDVGGAPAFRCSGILLSPTVFLTAGHCTSGTDAARVWFQSEVTDPFYPLAGGDAVEGTPFTHPLYDGFASAPDSNDVGIVTLNAPVILAVYGQLPDIGQLDPLAKRRGKQDTTFTVVGYGLQSVKPESMGDLVRYSGKSMLLELNGARTAGFNVRLSNNPGGKASGGLCFGDSGGPALFDDTDVVAAIGSLAVNRNCVGSDLSHRIDTESAQDFINSFLP
jgi:hypothetical protein